MMLATGPWPVMMVSIGLLLFGATAFMFVPETLKHHDTDEETAPQEHPVGFRAHLSHMGIRMKESLSILKSPSLILLAIICLASTPFLVSVLQFLILFVSKRFHVPIKYTGFVQTAFGVAQVIHAFVVLPWISNLLMKDSAPRALKMANEQERDLALAKWSFGFVFLGFLALGTAPNITLFIVGLVIMAIGSASGSLIRSLMSLYVDPEHRSRLFSMLGMIEVIGSLYGSPMTAGLFALGMKLAKNHGEGWIGLPYYGLSVLAVIIIAILQFVRVPKHVTDAAPASEEGGTHVE
jgi:MFS family permease